MLFVHRNTIGNRIGRIRSITGLDLDTVEGHSLCLLASEACRRAQRPMQSGLATTKSEPRLCQEAYYEIQLPRRDLLDKATRPGARSDGKVGCTAEYPLGARWPTYLANDRLGRGPRPATRSG